MTGLERKVLKERLRTGTVVTTDDRNWELRFDDLAMRFNQSRAIAIDMESATIAANGYRFRVPYGTLLCVSDRPLHGEIKLPGMADAFYEERVSQHLQIGIRPWNSCVGGPRGRCIRASCAASRTGVPLETGFAAVASMAACASPCPSLRMSRGSCSWPTRQDRRSKFNAPR